MNRKPRELALVAVSVACLLILAACNCAPTLRYITISPATSTIGVGTTQQFTATGYYSNGSTTPGMSVTWGSSSSAVATIDSTGVATGVATGTTSITATAFGITATPATLNVNQLISIAITPATAAVAAGGTQQYTSMGTFKNADGSTSTSDITTTVTWAATPATVATIDNTTNIGLATGVASGSATITASLDGVTSNSATLNVGAAIPASLVITPGTASIAIGTSTAVTVQEKWTDGTLHDPTGTVTWSSSTPADAWVVPTSTKTASVAGFAAGTPSISATEGTLTTMTPAAITVSAGTTHYAFIGNGGDGTISQYTVDATTAPYMTPAGTVTTSGSFATQTALDPNGLYLYQLGTSTNTTISVFNVSNTGTLTAASFGATIVNASAVFAHEAIDPYGRFLYVADGDDNQIYIYQISQTDGSLTAVTGSPYTDANLQSPTALLIDHTGGFLYAINSNSNTISSYTINQTLSTSGGALTPLAAQPTIATGGLPSYPAMDPAGAFIYVPNSNDGTVSTFSLATDGTLTNAGTTTVTGITSVLNVLVDPSDKHLYVLDQGDGTNPGALYLFNLTAGVPGTTPIGSPVNTGVLPQGLAIDPTGALLATDNTLDDTVSLYTVASDGTLTAQTPVATGVGPTFVNFFNAP